MKSSARGKSTFLEITNISQHGFWLFYGEHEYFVPFEKFPWFKNAELDKIFNVQLQGAGHFYWPDLDVDLSEKILCHPEKFHLVSKSLTNKD
jgi:hypothetical protein